MSFWYMNFWLCEYSKSELDQINYIVHRLDRKYESVCLFFDDVWVLQNQPIWLSDLQISEITVVCFKIPLFCLQIWCPPRLAYRHVFLHNRSRTRILQALYRYRLSPLRLLFMLFVCPVLFWLLTTHSKVYWPYIPTSHAYLNVSMSSVHMQSQAQSAGRCLFIYLASLATSSSSVGILWSRWRSWK